MEQLLKLQSELEQVEAAITAAYGGSEYEIRAGQGSRRLKRQSLDVLLRRKSELQLAISRVDGTGSRGIRHGVPV